jgi:polyribonucleotide nucleotidyltransferase
MSNVVSESINWGSKEIYIETGRFAKQATSAVFLRCGNNSLLCTVVIDEAVKEGVNFLPLTVNCVYKSYASGKIPSGFFKREGKPSEREILSARIIDRAFRPLFPETFFNEVQVVCHVLSSDSDSDSDVLGLIAASAALLISGAPISQVAACARVGYIEEKFVLNPSYGQLQGSGLDLLLAGSESSVLMVESAADSLSEQVVLDAIEFAHQSLQPVIQMLHRFHDKIGRASNFEFSNPDISGIYTAIKSLSKKKFLSAYAEPNKKIRTKKLGEIKSYVLETLLKEDYHADLINCIIKKYSRDLLRARILEEERIDKRRSDEIRDIDIVVDFLPKVHGSTVFTRGGTQSIVATTLGATGDEQITEDVDGEYREHFMLHYNFPSYSVGEVTPLRPPGRREIGHGKLAWKALRSVLPDKEKFPYTIRVVSEITESDGSSSMATVCGSSLSLMDAGVPIKHPVAGIAMGLIKESDKFVILSDILGIEDYLGDMDFKVAGTNDGITALQMDIKIDGLNKEIMSAVLKQARAGLNHILKKMSNVLSAPRNSLKEYAPRIVSFVVDKEKIRDIIGTGGRTIREICESSGAKIDISQDGTVKIAAANDEMLSKANSMIDNIITEPEIGMVYDGVVVKVADSGAFVQFFGERWGFVHISEVKEEHVSSLSAVVKESSKVKVLFKGFDRGRAQLSMKRVDQKSGELIASASRDAAYGAKARGTPRKNNKFVQAPRGAKPRNENDSINEKDKKPRFF